TTGCGVQDSVIFEHDRFSVESCLCLSKKCPIFDSRKSLFKNRRFDLPFISELSIGAKVSMIKSALLAQLLGHRQVSMRFNQTTHGIDLCVDEAGVQPNATHADTVTGGALNDLVSRFA